MMCFIDISLTPSCEELLFPLVSLFLAVCLTLVSSMNRKPVAVVPWQHSKPNSLGWPHTELPLTEFITCLWLCAPLGGSRGFSNGLTWALFKGAVKNLSYFPYHTFFIITTPEEWRFNGHTIDLWFTSFHLFLSLIKSDLWCRCAAMWTNLLGCDWYSLDGWRKLTYSAVTGNLVFVTQQQK